MKIKKGDFIELDYTGRVVEDNGIFDTTIPADAREAGLIHDHPDGEHHHEHGHHHFHEEDFKPVIICVGQSHVLPGLDKKFEDLALGKHEIKLSEEDAFGKKNSKLLKLIPLNVFKEQKINPHVGLVLNIDDSRGVIRSVNGGRIIVDFNHPLAGKEVVYSVDLKKIVEDPEQKVKALLSTSRLPYSDLKVEGNKASAKLAFELPKELVVPYLEDVKKLSGVELEFVFPEKKEKTKNEPTKTV